MLEIKLHNGDPMLLMEAPMRLKEYSNYEAVGAYMPYSETLAINVNKNWVESFRLHVGSQRLSDLGATDKTVFSKSIPIPKRNT